MEWKLRRHRENEKKQTITISIAAGNYDTEIIIDLINQAIQEFRVKYQESSIGFGNVAYLQSIENECKWFSMIEYVLSWSDLWVKGNEIISCGLNKF